MKILRQLALRKSLFFSHIRTRRLQEFRAASATSAAGQSTTETRAIGYSQTEGLATGSVPASSASSSSHSAGIATHGPSKGQMVALGFTAVGLLAGGFFAMA